MTRTIAVLALIALVLTALIGCGTAAPQARFSATPTRGYAPLEVQFADMSTGNISSWEWDLNKDGEVDSTAQNPKHIYEAAGNYTIALKVSGPDGNDTEEKSDYIEVIPCPRFADFIAELPGNCQVQGEGIACVGTTRVQFTDKSKGNVTGWEWDFNNDGVIDSTMQNPSHTYTRNGNYTVILTISTLECKDTMTKWDYINIAGCKT